MLSLDKYSIKNFSEPFKAIVRADRDASSQRSKCRPTRWALQRSIPLEQLLRALLRRETKGKEAKRSYERHVPVENHHGLVVAAEFTPAHGQAEHDALLLMAPRLGGNGRVAVRGDTAYNATNLAEHLGRRKTPHVARSEAAPGGSAIDAGFVCLPDLSQNDSRLASSQTLFRRALPLAPGEAHP